MLDIFEFLFTLDLPSVILSTIIIFILNILFYVLVRNLVIKKYRSTNSPELSLYLEKNLIKYLGFIIFLLSSFIIAFIIIPHIDFLGKFSFPALLIIVFAFMMLVQICRNLILFNINKEIRGTTITKKEQIINLVKFLLFASIPVILFFSILELKPYKFFVKEDMQDYAALVFPLILYLLINIAMLPFQKYLLKGKTFEDEEIYKELYRFIESTGIKNFKLYTWSTKNTKHANALVAGIKNKEVYISDYLLENFTLEETKAVLSHEIGHIKKHHILKRFFYNIAMFIIIPLVYYYMNKLQGNNYMAPLITILIIISIIIFYIFFLRYFIYRKHEREADLYVLELGNEKDVYISALIKLSNLNNSLMKQNKLDEKFQTHPSIARRIDEINKA